MNDHTSPIATLVLYAWIPIVQVLFLVLPPRRAVLAAYLSAWLFLPVTGVQLPLLPDFTKMFATSVGVLIAVILFDSRRLTKLRPRVWDIPMALWCIAPFFASIANGLGPYDGVSAATDHVIDWGLAYLVGRMYFADLRSLKELGAAVVIAGLIYVPLCLFESIMSPQLHRMVYGFHAHSFAQTYRFGGWRPTVFMQHGLMVAMWMTACALVGIWMWWTGAMRRLWGVPMVWVVCALVLGVLLMRSVNAYIAFAIGLACLASIRWLRTPLAITCLAAAIPGYMALRTIGGWDGQELVYVASAAVNPDRAASLETRLTNANMLTDKALQRPAFGWGRWGRSRIYDAYGNDVSTTDSLWVIALGQTGLVGLAALTGVFLTPFVHVRNLAHKGRSRDPAVACAIVMGLILVLAMMDNLLNAMVNPIFTIMAGALAGLVIPRRNVRSRNAQTEQTPAPAMPMERAA